MIFEEREFYRYFVEISGNRFVTEIKNINLKKVAVHKYRRNKRQDMHFR